jgi:AcrR family transcriptional regulator
VAGVAESDETPGDSPLPRRGRRPDGDARADLIHAAQALMAARPSGRITVREIAARAGCDVALVNYYFGSKEGLFDAALDAALEEIRHLLEALTTGEGSSADQIRRLIEDPIFAMGERRHLPRVLIGQVLLERGPRTDRYIAALGLSYLKSVQAIVEDGVRDGTFRQVDARALVYSFAAIPAFFFLMAPVLERILGEEAVSQEAVGSFAKAVADLVLNGILSDEARAGEDDPPRH